MNWCKHIKRIKNTYSGTRWRIAVTQHGVIANPVTATVPRSWKVCPICEAPRPTRENINAAKLQFAMDNDS